MKSLFFHSITTEEVFDKELFLQLFEVVLV
jgi:hypothetical protein